MNQFKLRRSAIAAACLLAAAVAQAGSVTLTFDDAVSGRAFYAYDADADGTPDIVLSTSDPSGFNTAGPGPNQRFINEPGIEGTTRLQPDLRVNFVRGAVNAMSFGYAVIQQGLGVTFSLFNANDQLLASTSNVASFHSLANGGTSSFPEALVNLAFSGTAAYGTFDFGGINSNEVENFGRYIIDNLSTDFAGGDTLPGFEGIIPSDPILPGAVVVNPDGTIRFDFSLLPVTGGPGVNSPLFIDPDVAVGYEYRVTSGPRFSHVLVPSALPNGDGLFRLVVDGYADQVLNAGVEFNLLSLNANGFEAFRILDIDTSEALVPTDPLAFVTGVRFVTGGAVSLTQTPITQFVNANPASEPAALSLVLLSLGVMTWVRRRP